MGLDKIQIQEEIYIWIITKKKKKIQQFNL